MLEDSKEYNACRAAIVRKRNYRDTLSLDGGPCVPPRGSKSRYDNNSKRLASNAVRLSDGRYNNTKVRPLLRPFAEVGFSAPCACGGFSLETSPQRYVKFMFTSTGFKAI